jgi:hypothetical protein
LPLHVKIDLTQRESEGEREREREEEEEEAEEEANERGNQGSTLMYQVLLELIQARIVNSRKIRA